jgi:hypothetical protein
MLSSTKLIVVQRTEICGTGEIDLTLTTGSDR